MSSWLQSTRCSNVQISDSELIVLSISLVISIIGPPNKKKSPKKYREYLDKQNARRTAKAKLKKEEEFKVVARPYIREAVRRAHQAWSQAYDSKIARANLHMRKNAELQRWPELLTWRFIMRSEELWNVRKEIERTRKEGREVKATLQKEISGLRIELRTAQRKLRRQW